MSLLLLPPTSPISHKHWQTKVKLPTSYGTVASLNLTTCKKLAAKPMRLSLLTFPKFSLNPSVVHSSVTPLTPKPTAYGTPHQTEFLTRSMSRSSKSTNFCPPNPPPPSIINLQIRHHSHSHHLPCRPPQPPPHPPTFPRSPNVHPQQTLSHHPPNIQS